MFKKSLSSSLLVLGLSTSGSVMAEDKITVISSFSILGDLVSEVGKEHVSVQNLVKADGDSHVFNPSPQDAKALSKADLVVINGLDFEGWMPRLIQASNYKGMQVVATNGIDAISSSEDEHHDHDKHEEHDEHHDHDKHEEHDEHHDHDKHEEHDEHHDHDKHEEHDEHHDHDKHEEHDEHHDHDKHEEHDEHHDHDKHEEHDEHHDHDKHEEHGEHAGHHHGDVDPHAWHSIKNVKVYVQNIAEGLSKVDPSNKSDYQQNAHNYIQTLEQLELDLNAQLASIPASKRKVITAHDAFGYFARDFKIEFLAPQGTSTEYEANASDVAALIRQIRKEDVRAVFMESVTDNRLIEQISRETKANIGGELYSDALSAADKPAATYIQMMQHNVDTIVKALK